MVEEDNAWFEIRKATTNKDREHPILRCERESSHFSTIDRRLKPLVLECQDDFFHHDSAVLMPDIKSFQEGPLEERPSFPCNKNSESLRELRQFHPEIYDTFVTAVDNEEDEEPEEDERVAGLCILSIAFKFMELNPQFKLLFAGHCDTTGSVEYNFELSKLRAQNVQYLMEGKRDEWVDICLKKFQVKDYQRILLRYAASCVWGCNPGPLDNIHGEITGKAVCNFQTMYNQAFDKQIKVDGIVGRETWGAFFDLYQAEIASVLDTTPENLHIYRNELRYVDPAEPCLGCSELFPIEQKYRDNFYSSINRRVEILFFHSDFLPSLSGSKEKKPYGIYGGALIFDHILPVMRGSEPILLPSEPEYILESFETEPEPEDELEIEFEAELSDDTEWGFLDDFDTYTPREEPYEIGDRSGE